MCVECIESYLNVIFNGFGSYSYVSIMKPHIRKYFALENAHGRSNI